MEQRRCIKQREQVVVAIWLLSPSQVNPVETDTIVQERGIVPRSKKEGGLGPLFFINDLKRFLYFL